jgi:hypothetical protein
MPLVKPPSVAEYPGAIAKAAWAVAANVLIGILENAVANLAAVIPPEPAVKVRPFKVKV